MGEHISDEFAKSLTPLSEQGLIEIISGSEVFFEWVMQNFRISGTRIDWEKARDVIEEVILDRIVPEDGIAFLRRLIACHRIALTEEVVVLIDGPIDVAIGTSVENLAVLLEEVLCLPDNIYVIPLAGDWCLAFTRSGSMTFGRSPKGASSK